MDITALTNAITLLRSETQERSISPERVGSLLQQLANLIKSAAEEAATQEEVNEIKNTALVDIATQVAALASSLTLKMTLTEMDGDTATRTFSLPVVNSTKAGIVSAADYNRVLSAINGIGTGAGITSEELAKFNRVASHFVRIGTESTFWVTSYDAEQEAAKLVFCADHNIWILYYFVKGSKFGYIEQYLNQATCTQTIHWNNAIKKRTITFTDETRTAIASVGDWIEQGQLTKQEYDNLAWAASASNATFTSGESEKKKKFKIWLTLKCAMNDSGAEYSCDIPLASADTMGVMSSADKIKLDALPTGAEINAIAERNNYNVKYLGNMGANSGPGEEAAAALDIVSDTKIKWVIYTYADYTAFIHQTHGSNSTTQDMYFAGSRYSRRTITFTDDTRTEISTVGNWTTIGADIGVNRSATTATIKMVHPLMESTAGLLSLTLGQANTTKAGLMTAANLQLLNSLNTAVTQMQETISEIQEEIQNLKGS